MASESSEDVQLVLAEAVRDEVEENLLMHAASLSPATANTLLEDYAKLIKLCRPEMVPYPAEAGSDRGSAPDPSQGPTSMIKYFPP